ncbi:MAG: 50S ribosomal protein L11 methyltransferase [Bacteriovoracaceae bacterium]|nr:50S ribosomal protein L11 methyltransferase [Bacteriovoracaceae bacterium]
MEYIYIVAVKAIGANLTSESMDQIALEKYKSSGKIDFNLNESAVDEILGKDAYCGGDIPEEVLLKLEEAMSEKITPTFYWEDKEMAQAFSEHLINLGCEVEQRQEEKSDWNESWRESFSEIMVTDTLKVVPSWEMTKNIKEEIYIYPGMGFGTGNHETTYLCLKIFSDIKDDLGVDIECLDFGCGSGILGIAAMKQIGARVDFVDIDKDALDNCLSNLNYNNYQDYREDHGLILRDRFNPKSSYPLVFANILENILLEEYKVIEQSVSEKGFLIVSGLLSGQEITITEAYSGFKLLKKELKGDWVALLFQKA